MKCKILNNDLILYAEDSLPSERRDTLESHLKECSECREFLVFLRESMVIIEQDKVVDHNPFLYTRIMAKLEPKERYSHVKKLIPALTFSLILLAGIFVGIDLGKYFFGNNPPYSADLHEEIRYLDDIKQEPIETFFITSNNENNE